MTNVTAPAPKQDFLAGVLSYLVPGLGQIYQGRTGKGILFLVGIYGLFFYGMFLGKWHNVYLPQAVEHPGTDARISLTRDFFARPQFLGQFWTGVVAWPAIVQYVTYDGQRAKHEKERNPESDFDPEKNYGPYFGTWQRTPYENREHSPPIYEHRTGAQPEDAPTNYPGKTIGEQQTNDDKSYDIGW